jgi:hypothetical protein
MPHCFPPVATCRVWAGCLRGWIMLWMLAVPLFHVHPETDHHHGELGHVHGGTVHTVWSQDLECESIAHDQGPQSGGRLSAHPVHNGMEHPEFGFSVLSDTKERKNLNLLASQTACLAPAVAPDFQRSDPGEPDVVHAPAAVIFFRDIPARAPPSSLV